MIIMYVGCWISTKQAFLNSKIDNSTAKQFLRFPPGLNIDGHNHGLLKIVLYGKLDAGKEWYDRLHAAIMKVEPRFVCVKADIT